MAQYDITHEILPRIRAFLATAYPHLEVKVAAADWESEDDDIQFFDAAGHQLDVSIQSGPFGLSVNKSLYEEGQLTAMTHGALRQASAANALLRDLDEALKAAQPVPAGDGPNLRA